MNKTRTAIIALVLGSLVLIMGGVAIASSYTPPCTKKKAWCRDKRIAALEQAVGELQSGASPAPTVTVTASPSPQPTVTVTASPSPTPTPTPTATGGTQLIKYGQDIPNCSQFAAAKSTYESRPFDGWVIHDPARSGGTFSTTSYSQASYANELAKCPSGLVQSTHNFYRIILVHELDWYSDSQWATIASNLTHLSAALKASGKQFDGIFFDTEYYGGGTYPGNYGTSTTPWTYSATAGATPGKTAADARDEVRLRGRQVIDAVAAGWSTAKVIIAYGPWVGETKTFQSIGGQLAANNVAWANELHGTFGYGMIEATYHNNVQVIDGGEVYGARTPAQFQLLNDWRVNGFPQSGTPIIPAGETAAYTTEQSGRMSAGVYDYDVRNGHALFSASDLASLLKTAIDAEDGYVWLYTEKYEWGASQSGKPSVPASYPAAIAAIR